MQVNLIKQFQGYIEITLQNGTIINAAELMVLDFDGACNVSYHNKELNLAVDGIDIVASIDAETQAAILDQLNASANGIYYISSEDAARLQLLEGSYSTIYIGDTTDLDALGGTFCGIAETTGENARADKADNAFVLTNRIDSVEQLIESIQHEAGHLAGTISHDSGNDGATLDDYMSTYSTYKNIYYYTSSTFNGHTFKGVASCAIRVSGRLNISNCTLYSNRGGITYAGGAVRVFSHSSAVGIFYSNYFSYNSSISGGAVCVAGRNTFSGNTFVNNAASLYGGGLYCEKSATMNNDIFSKNYAGIGGGAVHVYASGQTTWLNGVQFIDNSAGSYGGAIYDYDGGIQTIALYANIFSNNSAVSGGAVKGGGFSIYSSIFNTNSANYGGAVYVNISRYIYIYSTNFTSNSATVSGGAVLVPMDGSASIQDANFTGNSADFGGAIKIGRSAGGGNYGSVYALNITLSNNHATSVGGGLYNAGSATFSGGSFISNSAGYGGAVYNMGTATLNNGTFTSNVAESFGGAFENNTGIINLAGGNLAGNSAVFGGGAFNNDAVATISNAVFARNSTQYGGGLRNDTAASATINGGGFSDNAVSELGGAVFNMGYASISGVSFHGNTAIGGGAVYNFGTASGILTNASFSGNNAENGGAVFNTASITFNTGTFDGNIASSYGGAVENTGIAAIAGVTFSGNSALLCGGAISNDGEITIVDGALADNAASFGGALFNEANASASVSKASLSNNNALYGGAIYNSAFLTLANGTYSSNIATSFGGAIDNCTEGNIIIDGPSINGNSAYAGGAVNNDGAVSAVNVKFIGNSAVEGGAFRNAFGASAGISATVFSANTAVSGGAIVNKGTAGVCNVTFSGNVANDGGALVNLGTANLTGGNVFATATDTICNSGTATMQAMLNISGSNSFGANLTNALYGSVVFDSAAVTTLTNSARLVNSNTSVQSLNGKIVVLYDSLTNATSSTELAVSFVDGDWNAGSAKAGTTEANAVSLGSSFTNANGARLWFGSNNGKTGITDNTLELNSTIGDADYSKFTTESSLFASYANFDGFIDVTGGTYTENLYGNNATLLFNEGTVTAIGKLVVCGHAGSVTGKDTSVTVNSVLTAGTIVAGDQYKSTTALSADVVMSGNHTVSITSASSLSQFVVGGNLLNSVTTGNYVFTDSGTKNVSVSGNASAGILTGGSIVGNTSKLTDGGSSTVTISGGTYSYVDGAGYLQGIGALLSKSGITTLTITGGSFRAIYGGVGSSDVAYAAHATVTGQVNININAINAITVTSIYGGCNGKATGFTADTTITFSGNGSNLTFTGSGGVAGGNGTIEKSASGTTGLNTLAFSGFTGNFGAPTVRDFDKVTFSNSTMTFIGALDLSDVTTWNFDGSSLLTWNNGSNNFIGDTLNFTGLTGSGIVIDSDGDDIFANLGSAAAVKLNGVDATWNESSKKWVASNGYSLLADTKNHNLIIQLA